MGCKFTREELYDLVWSEPISAIAPKYNVSDVAFSKACKRANIPRPHRGYWAKLKAGKPVIKAILPERFPGASNTVKIGYRYYESDYQPISLKSPLPTAPSFNEEMESIRKRVVKMVGKVSYFQFSNRTHPIIDGFLKRDEARKEEYKNNTYYWNEPKFDTPIERRRLRILNAIFLGCQKLGCRLNMSTTKYDNDNREATIHVGDHCVNFTLKAMTNTQSKMKNKQTPVNLILVIHGWHNRPFERISWQETEALRIEKNLDTIVTELIVSGELHYREMLQWRYELDIERRKQLQEEETQRKIEEERMARELLEQQEQAHIDQLLGEAHALQQAQTIRQYVECIRTSADRIDAPGEEIEKWACWALKQADRIDPIKNNVLLDFER